jgi:hypothetical protein
MRSTTLPVALGLALAALVLARSSQAQTTTVKPDGIIYDFKDDYMVGDTITGYTAILQLRPPPPRITLIRPRASFVAEMIKSVELM